MDMLWAPTTCPLSTPHPLGAPFGVDGTQTPNGASAQPKTRPWGEPRQAERPRRGPQLARRGAVPVRAYFRGVSRNATRVESVSRLHGSRGRRRSTERTKPRRIHHTTGMDKADARAIRRGHQNRKQRAAGRGRGRGAGQGAGRGGRGGGTSTSTADLGSNAHRFHSVRPPPQRATLSNATPAQPSRALQRVLVLV